MFSYSPWFLLNYILRYNKKYLPCFENNLILNDLIISLTIQMIIYSLISINILEYVLVLIVLT